MSLSKINADLLAIDPSSDDALDKLLDLVEQVSVDSPAPPGSPTVLYSGGVSGSLSGNDVVEQMLRTGQEVRVINATPAAEFLGSNEFENALAKATLCCSPPDS